MPSGSPLLNSQSPMLLPMTPDSPITPISSPIPSIQSTLALLPPMLSIIPSTQQTLTAHADLPSTLPLGHVNVIALQKELALYQKGYWTLKTDFDSVCDIIKSTPSQGQIAQKMQEKDNEIKRLSNELHNRKHGGKDMQNLHIISLEKEVKLLKYKIKQLEMDRAECNMKSQILHELSVSETKEIDLIAKDKAYIELLEKEKLIQSEYMEDYVKKNQTLQAALTDREMKLRQCQNKLNRMRHVKPKNNNAYVNANCDMLPPNGPTLGSSYSW